MWADDANAARIINALADFGFGSLDLVADDFLEQGSVIQLGHAPKRIDILTSIDGVDFNTCWERRVAISIDGLDIPFIAATDLIANKVASGRPQDLADAAALRALDAAPD